MTARARAPGRQPPGAREHRRGLRAGGRARCRRRRARRAPHRRRRARGPPRRRHPGGASRRDDAGRGARQRLPEVPTLGEVARRVRGPAGQRRDQGLPHQPGFDPSDRAAELLVDAARRRGPAATACSCRRSTSRPSTGSARLAPALPTAWLRVGADPARRARRSPTTHGHAALHPDVWSLPGDRAAELVAATRTTGASQVNVWTVNEPDELLRLAPPASTRVITDVPDLALEVTRGPTNRERSRARSGRRARSMLAQVVAVDLPRERGGRRRVGQLVDVGELHDGRVAWRGTRACRRPEAAARTSERRCAGRRELVTASARSSDASGEIVTGRRPT